MICPIPSLLCAVVREEKVKLETTKIFTAILHLHCLSFFFQSWSEDTAIHQLIIIIILIPCQVEKRSWTSQICNLCHLTQEHETEPVAKTKARQLGNFIWINLVPRRRGRQILTIIPDLPDPPSMLCFVISQVLGDTWPAFSRVSLSLAPRDGKERTLGTRLHLNNTNFIALLSDNKLPSWKMTRDRPQVIWSLCDQCCSKVTTSGWYEEENKSSHLCAYHTTTAIRTIK